MLSMRIAGSASEGFSQVKAGYGITFLVLSVPLDEASLRLISLPPPRKKEKVRNLIWHN